MTKELECDDPEKRQGHNPDKHRGRLLQRL